MLIDALRSERTSFHVMPDLNNTIKKFSGQRSPSAAKDWLAFLNSIGNMNNWPDSFCLQCDRANLEGASLNWYNAAEFKGWTEFEEEFKDTFIGRQSAELWEKMAQRCQHVNEDITDYFFDNLRLTQQLGLEFDDEKKFIIRGIKSIDLRKFLLQRQHNTFNNMISNIYDYIDVGCAEGEAVEG